MGEFSSDQIVCTRTLYNYVDQGLLAIRNSDLPEKLKRNTKIHRVHKNKKKLGRSIEERPKEINDRKEFGHWECDLVLGHKTRDDQVLLTLSERMSREFLILRIPYKTAASVMSAFQTLHKQYSEHWNEIFKTITTDNGSEFADLSNLEEVSNTLVYYAHPYTSCDKGTVERHNGLIRRFIITSITILFRKSLTLKPGAIRYQEKYWHIIHQMKSLKENWIISIKQLKCSIYYCNLRQLDFLKKHDFSYKQALKCSKKAIMNQVGIFIKENKIDNLISWGHSLDYSVLENEGYKKLLPGNMKSFDLEEILAQANGNSNLSLNLEKFCKVLNLNNTGKCHDALDDAKMIKKICELYLNVLVTLPKVKSNLPHLLGSDSTKLSLVAPSED